MFSLAFGVGALASALMEHDLRSTLVLAFLCTVSFRVAFGLRDTVTQTSGSFVRARRNGAPPSYDLAL